MNEYLNVSDALMLDMRPIDRKNAMLKRIVAEQSGFLD